MNTASVCQGAILSLVLGAFAFSATNSPGQAPSEPSPSNVLLQDGTPIHLVLTDDVQGKTAQAKQVLHFKVREDLVVHSTVVVKTGAAAVGHLESISKSGLFGKSGRLVLQFDNVQSVSGTKIPLRGGASVNGGKGGALTWESAMWFGPDASLSVGTVINAYIDKDQQIPLP